MRFLKLALLVGGLMLLSGVVSGEDWRRGPSLADATTPDPLCVRGIAPGATCYWAFDENDTADSPVISITAEYATLAFDPNVANDGSSNAQIELRRIISTACTGPSTVASLNTSQAISNGVVSILTGDGDHATRAAFIFEVPTGCYFIAITTVSTAENAIVSLTGAPVGRQ